MEYLQYAYEKIFGADATLSDGTQGIYQTPRKVVCFGNVLLDRIVKLEEPELLQRYELKLGSKGEMDLQQLSNMATEAASSSGCLSNPGGSALNTVRILKQLGTDAQFFGAIGADKHGELLHSILLDRGIEARLQIIEDVPTGQCVCLMHNDNPTLYANVGASAHFSVEELKRAASHDTQSFLRPIERKQILYIEGFFLPQRSEVVDYIQVHLVRERRYLALNLSAPYIVRQHSDKMLELARRALLIFGNRQEFEELAKTAGCQRVEQLAQQLLQSGSQPKIILITNGAAGVQLATNYVAELSPPGELRFEDYRAQRAEQLVDATGAGDAFVAGFLHAWLEKRSLSECVRLASQVAAKVVTQVGCNLP
ncbi:adenosine kinase [Drosophila novamexicana]|uniref:adenosine kinase n=1 Tax=Drosophila novamexicana TaxID=47314 RepID=UPI0011E59863|nr:adenosine kinase [Drosophila novamexicana]